MTMVEIVMKGELWKRIYLYKWYCPKKCEAGIANYKPESKYCACGRKLIIIPPKNNKKMKEQKTDNAELWERISDK